MKKITKEEALINIAKRVKWLRQQKGISQQNAYNDTGIHFGRLEQANSDVGYLTLLRICDYFEISLADFFKEGFD
jgi:transcriptional regulator with XRE-family HTH domain